LSLSEDDCIICGKWPEKDRWALREMIDGLPLDDGPICDECLIAFWRAVAGPELLQSNIEALEAETVRSGSPQQCSPTVDAGCKWC
jgi:hypothetical protein